MSSLALKKQFDSYLPLLSSKQQNLVLEMVKSFLNVDSDEKRISKKQYNKELEDAIARIEKGEFLSHEEALLALSKW